MFALLVIVPVFFILAFVAYLIREKRFLLRDLLWFILVTACLLGWWHDHRTLYWQTDWYKRTANLTNRRSDAIIAATRKAGYDIQFDDNDNFQGMRFLKEAPLIDIQSGQK